MGYLEISASTSEHQRCRHIGIGIGIGIAKNLFYKNRTFMLFPLVF